MTRFIVDFFRYYESSMTLVNLGDGTLSVNQGISMLICGVGFFLLGRLRQQGTQKKPRSAPQKRRSPSSQATS
jgi:hypothetical protein